MNKNYIYTILLQPYNYRIIKNIVIMLRCNSANKNKMFLLQNAVSRMKYKNYIGCYMVKARDKLKKNPRVTIHKIKFD